MSNLVICIGILKPVLDMLEGSRDVNYRLTDVKTTNYQAFLICKYHLRTNTANNEEI